jgi:hypothetical protein
VPKQVDDFGDTATAADDRCTTTEYAANTTAWLLSYPSQVRTVAVRCGDTPDVSKDLISDVRTYYDGGGWDAAPSKGDVTKVEKAKTATSGTVTYLTTGTTAFDAFGREHTVTDALNQTTITDYTETQGLTTAIKVTTPPAKAGDTTTTLTTSQDLDPAWGNAVKQTDAGGKVTNFAYDAL